MTDPLLAELVRRPLDHDGPVATAQVPCGVCRRCCRGNSIVMLMPQHGDVLASYEHEYVDLPGAGSGPVLRRKENGDCVYLGDAGCTIHGRAPAVCRVFDCRGAWRAFAVYPRHERKRMIRDGYVDAEIMAIGRRLAEPPRGKA